MPQVFQRLPLGNLFGVLFFGSIFLIALLSLIAAYEVLVAAAKDGLGWSRRRTLTLILVSQLILAIPSMLSTGILFYNDLIWVSTMQPLGAAIAVVALTWSLGRARALEELRRNSSLPFGDLLFYWVKYVIPLGILVTLVYGWITTLWPGSAG